MEFNAVKDSGERREFETGARRDIAVGKGRFDLLPYYPLYRLARHFENGAVKYGDDNWRKGIPLRCYVDSALRHLLKFNAGMRDEDHLAAAMWNAACLMWTEEEIRCGRLPDTLNNLHPVLPE
jgi:hypothetical protein